GGAKKDKSKDLSFFIQADRLGISSRRSRVYHQHGKAVLYLITPKVCIKNCRLDDMQPCGLMICNDFVVDDMQGFALMYY
ncbi:MAG: hypothetical protein IKM06_02365, partial [Clostridia bacterium]|nr:hypothetical protein [Clostridia bacterium]